MISALRKVIKRMHYPLEVMLTCVRWYVAYPLSLRHIAQAQRFIATEPEISLTTFSDGIFGGSGVPPPDTGESWDTVAGPVGSPRLSRLHPALNRHHLADWGRTIGGRLNKRDAKRYKNHKGSQRFEWLGLRISTR
jgi:hypothetical protein